MCCPAVRGFVDGYGKEKDENRDDNRNDIHLKLELFIT
jgi:hypothetical protein